MTSRRQDWKERWPLRAVIAALLVAGCAAAAWAQTTERVVTDRHTGLAIGGMDPVAYFTDKAMLPGSQDFELAADGVVWRFRNEDNRTFFKASPAVYSPQFGGYDPVDVARGIAVAGTPRLWLIWRDRLYLFTAEDNRDRFLAEPETVVRRALNAWPALIETLAR